MKVFKIYWIAVLALLFVVAGCDKGEDPGNESVPKYLVESELTNEEPIESGSISTLLNFNGLEDLASKVKYNVNVYKIVYKTLFEGDSIRVSGLVATPVPTQSKDKFPMLSFQHGTLFQKSDAPTENGSESKYMAYLASIGMVVVIPDYIGFGESANLLHPYMNNEYTVNAVLDMIRASKEFIQVEDPCNINDDLFLFGYSQGGSATVGSLAAIETNAANSDLTVKAASSGGGAYDLVKFREWIMQQQLYEKPSYIAYILESYSQYSNVDIDYSLVFNNDFVDIPGSIDGEVSESEIDQDFNTHYVDELFNDDFENDSIFENADAYASLKQAFEDNKISAWPISAALYLYAGNKDVWVPGEQSIRLFQDFQQEGVGSKVKLTQLPDMNHTSAFVPTLISTLEKFGF